MVDFDQSLVIYQSRRSPVVGKGGMTAASQPLAAAAGLEILRAGGNAADAAVGMAAALNVTEPTSTGIGGDCFALYFDAQTGKVHALNGSGRAPASLTLQRLQHEGFDNELPPFHAYTITVPGACSGWCDLVERFGVLPLSDTLAPAIHLAEEGFPVAPLTAFFWQKGVERQLKHAPGGLALTLDGRAPNAGEIFRNPGLARTFRKIAEGGKAAFYQGEIAESIVAIIQRSGGCLAIEDLAAHQSTWEEPISITYRGKRIWECPPNGQGLAALLALNIVEGFDLAALPALSRERLHLEIEAMRLAFADANWYIADPVFYPAPLYDLLSKEYAAARRRLINPHKADRAPQRGTPVAGSDTVYFCVVDRHGNACSFINSNYMGFGTGIVPEGWGFSLHNRGHNFSLNPAHPNTLAPGKRPYHTIIPGMITQMRDPVVRGHHSHNESEHNARADLCAAFGVMGGFMQPQGHLQVVSAMLDDHLDPQAALDRARFCIEDGSAGGCVAIEEGISTSVVESLAGMGHSVRWVDGHERAMFGRGQIIVRDIQNGVLWGGSDPRADGCAMPG